MIKNKKCIKCHLLLGIDNFHKNKRTKDGLQNICKSCRRKWQQDNKEKVNLRVARYRDKHREECINRSRKWKEKQRANPVFVDLPQKWVYNSIIHSANIRNIQVKITYQELKDSYVPACALSGKKLFCTKTEAQSKGNQNASLDRIDSSKGYELGNIQWVDLNINYAKQQLSQEEFIQMCKGVVNHSINII